MDLPRNLVTWPDAATRLQFANSTVCSLRIAVGDGGEGARAETVFGTWSASGNMVRLQFGDATAEYEWRDNGQLRVGEADVAVPLLWPRFEQTIGRLPPAPLLGEESWRELLAPPQPPRGLQRGLMGAMMRATRHLPWWLRAPVITAAILVALTLLRALWLLESAADLADVGRAVGVVALAGLAGGAVPTLLFVPLRGLGYVGSLINGVVGTCCYLLACELAFMQRIPDGSWSFFGVSTGFGLLIGHLFIHPLAVASRSKQRQST